MAKSKFEGDKSITEIEVPEAPPAFTAPEGAKPFQFQYNPNQYNYDLPNNPNFQRLVDMERQFPVQRQQQRPAGPSSADDWNQKMAQMAALQRAPQMAAAPPKERMVSIYKDAPYGYPAGASAANDRIPEHLLQAYLSQGWKI